MIRLKVDHLKEKHPNRCSRTRDTILIILRILLPYQTLAPTLPTMQYKRWQFSQRSRCVMLVMANVASSHSHFTQLPLERLNFVTFAVVLTTICTTHFPFNVFPLCHVLSFLVIQSTYHVRVLDSSHNLCLLLDAYFVLTSGLRCWCCVSWTQTWRWNTLVSCPSLRSSKQERDWPSSAQSWREPTWPGAPMLRPESRLVVLFSNL